MICEPNLNLPVHVDISFLQKSEKPFFAAQDVELKTSVVQQYLTQPVQVEYSHQNDHLKLVLSLKENDYLRCRWHKFLDKVPENYVQIRLYGECKIKKQETRNMQLTGKFYNNHNKLVPIPVMPDSRQFGQSHHYGMKKKSMKPI